MQYARTMTAAALTLAAVACGDTAGVTVEDLLGDWNATQYLYTNNADPTQQADVVALGASFEMTVTSDGTASTLFTDAQGGTSSDSGTLNPEGTVVTIAGNAFEAQRSGNLLTLRDETNSYDFDDDGSDESATLTILMVRQ